MREVKEPFWTLVISMLDRESFCASLDGSRLTCRNYTIELSYVTPLDSVHPRSNLVARDRSMSNGPGSEDFPYSGQSFVSDLLLKTPL